jgi:hypothetical protein
MFLTARSLGFFFFFQKKKQKALFRFTENHGAGEPTANRGSDVWIRQKVIDLIVCLPLQQKKRNYFPLRSKYYNIIQEQLMALTKISKIGVDPVGPTSLLFPERYKTVFN